MSTDFENELRDLFREKAGEAPLATPTMPASAPRHVLRRSRIHQLGTVLSSAAVVVALIVGSVAGLTRILGEGEDRVGGDDYEVFQRTATIEAFTVGSPSDWFLVNEWPMSMVIAVQGSAGTGSACMPVPGDPNRECANPPGDETTSPIPVPHGLPMLQLSNVDLGLASNACVDGIPGDAAVLYVALDYDAAIAGVADPSIPAFPPNTGLPPEGDGSCGPGRYARFTVNGERFFAWIGVGPDASDEDRETVEDSYEMMSAIPDWTPTPPNETTPAYVIAGGTSEGGEGWRLELRPGAPSPVMTLDTSGGAAVSASMDEVLSGSSYEPEPADPIFGAIAKAATGVEFRPGTEDTNLDLGRSPVEGTIVPLPPTMSASDFDLFFIDPPEGYTDLGGHVIALGLEASSGEPSVSPPPVAESRTHVVTFRDTRDGHDWMARFRGDFEDGTACIEVTIDGEGSDPLCPRPLATSLASDQPSLHVVNTADLAVVVGSVPPEVVEIRFTSDSANNRATQFLCQMGPLGWTDPDSSVCAVALPPQDGGTFEYLDADGDVLFEDGMGWFVSQGEPVGPMPVDPLHGNTYWATYVWVGAAGTPESNEVVGKLSDDFGIQAIQGEVGCDEGAAEALGPGAAWRVAVYFETRGDASAFADDYRIRYAGSDPVIAQVTTYCLD
jgi:hypothetical protein